MSSQVVKCASCKKEAEFDSPKNYCAKHWAEWWNEDCVFPSEEARKRDTRNMVRRIRYKNRQQNG